MDYVYIVYYDNGSTYSEDRQCNVNKVFANEADAEAYAAENNKRMSECEEENWMGWEPFYSVEKRTIQ